MARVNACPSDLRIVAAVGCGCDRVAEEGWAGVSCLSWDIGEPAAVGAHTEGFGG
jgi:hypothetical protein